MISKNITRYFFLIITINLIACVDSQYGGYPNYPSQQYPNAGGYQGYPPQYPPSYPNYPTGGYNYPYQGYPNNYPPPQYPYRYPNRDRNDHRDRDHDRNHGRDNHHDNRNSDNHNPPPRVFSPPPKPAPEIVSPSCPPGSKYDGRSCIITDNRLRKPGGDGRINPCPKGMWNSGGTCVKDR